MHPSQPGSWRFMRGHMQREHPELATQEIFSYFECEHYTCRVKFCTRRARDIHEMCHDEVRDMQFFCFQCGWVQSRGPTCLLYTIKNVLIFCKTWPYCTLCKCTCSQCSNRIWQLSNILMNQNLQIGIVGQHYVSIFRVLFSKFPKKLVKTTTNGFSDTVHWTQLQPSCGSQSRSTSSSHTHRCLMDSLTVPVAGASWRTVTLHNTCENNFCVKLAGSPLITWGLHPH